MELISIPNFRRQMEYDIQYYFYPTMAKEPPSETLHISGIAHKINDHQSNVPLINQPLSQTF
jgi:hypothetical protein